LPGSAQFVGKSVHTAGDKFRGIMIHSVCLL
jgi:hypothetical protein